MGNPILGTHVVTQIGILVKDIERTAQDYADFFGVDKPKISSTGVYDEALTTYYGKPTLARTKQAFFDIGLGIQIELLEPDQEPSTWRHDLDEKGEGVHHIAFNIDGMQEKIQICQGQGMPLLQTGQWATGSYAYIDANEKLKLVLELLEHKPPKQK